jgi:hypothetical protein
LGKSGLFAVGLMFVNAVVGFGATVSFSGNFKVDDDVQLFNYSVPNTALVTIGTTSYAVGGFQTILTLFDAAGNFLFDNTGYGTATDASITWNSLGGQQFIVALTQYDNFAFQPTLADGFTEQGNLNFTAELPFNNPIPGGQFLLPGGEQRTSAWTVQFSSTETLTASQVGAAVPEPAAIFLTAAGLLACCGFGRRKAIRN